MRIVGHVMVALLGLAQGCATTKQPHGPLSGSVNESGFLKDLYADMKRGGRGDDLLVYINPRDTALASDAYDRVLLDAVKIYYGPDSRMKNVPRDQLQAFADMFGGKLAESLSQDYLLVTNAGPKTLRVQVAITDVQRTRGILKAVSFVPLGVPGLKFVILKAREALTGKPVFQGEATAEARVSDAETGETLWASVDRRVGTRLGGGWKSWTDVEDAFQYWADDIRYELCSKLRHRADCIPRK